MRMPIIETIQQYIEKKPMRFHVPGHKASPEFLAIFPSADLDITELDFSDNLACPQGILWEEQQLLAQTFGGEYALISTCGCTFCNQVMVYVASRYSSTLLVAQNAHRSVFSACELFGIEPIIVAMSYLNPEGIEQLLGTYPNVSGLLVTYPDYFGNGLDVERVSKTVHAYGKLLFVDSAHGSHLGFSNLYPPSATGFADMVALSLHKTLPVLTQGAILVMKREQFAFSERAFRLLHTSSPSYLIMASIDYARTMMAEQGKEKLEELWAWRKKLEKSLMFPLRVLVSLDPSRLVIDTSLLGFTTFQLNVFLDGEGVYAEIVDGACLVFVLTVCDTASSIERLGAVLNKLAALGEKTSKSSARKEWDSRKTFDSGAHLQHVRELAFLQAVICPSEWIDLANACGRISADSVGTYPPGIPNIMAGERYTKEVWQYLWERRSELFGCEHGKVKVII